MSEFEPNSIPKETIEEIDNIERGMVFEDPEVVADSFKEFYNTLPKFDLDNSIEKTVIQTNDAKYDVTYFANTPFGEAYRFDYFFIDPETDSEYYDSKIFVVIGTIIANRSLEEINNNIIDAMRARLYQGFIDKFNPNTDTEKQLPDSFLVREGSDLIIFTNGICKMGYLVVANLNYFGSDLTTDDVIGEDTGYTMPVDCVRFSVRDTYDVPIMMAMDKNIYFSGEPVIDFEVTEGSGEVYTSD